MRHRRAERCLVRAELAFDAGLVDEARAAVDEARALDPDSPAVLDMDARLAAAIGEPDLPLQAELPAAPAIAVDRAEKGRRVDYPLALGLAFASLALVAAASLGWRAVLKPAVPVPVNASLRGDVTLPADPVLDTVPEPSPARTTEPTGSTAESEPEPEPAAISTSGVTDLPAPPPVQRRPEPSPAPMPPAPIRPERSVNAPPPSPSRSASSSTSAITAPPPYDPAPRSTTEDPRPAPSVKAPALESAPLSANVLPAPGSISVAAPEAPAPVRGRTPESAAPLVEAQSAIRSTLARYAAAYSGLNVSAARAVWPGVDERALARAFDGLASQRVALESCDIAVSGTTAHATCSGTTEWTPKVGGGQRRQNRRWAFDLANATGGWQIVRAEAR
jgi:hypothetical protein